jgi:phospholipid/cholesterol/gamma-HCH transport system substrate-binding protein
MSQHRRNFIVGLTAGVGLLLLMVMIVLFSNIPMRIFASKKIPIRFETETSEGLSEGSAIFYKGVNVGHVVSIRRSDDQTRVLIDAMVVAEPPPPGNVFAKVRTTSLLGSSSAINLALPTERKTVQTDNGMEEMDVELPPLGFLVANQKIETRFVGLDLLPPEITNLANDLRLTSQSVRQFAQQFMDAKVFDDVKKNMDALHRTLASAEKAFNSADTLLSDQKMRDNLQKSMENLQLASTSAVKIGKDLEKFSENANANLTELSDEGKKLIKTAQGELEGKSRQLGQSLDSLASALKNIDQAASKLNDNKGTAGKFLNDPALYETLLDATKDLKLTIQDIRRLVDQWEQDGLSLKMK